MCWQNHAFHYIPLNWIVILSLIFYVNWCIFTVTAFHSLLFPLVKYLLTYFFLCYLLHFSHWEITKQNALWFNHMYMTVYKKAKVCMFGCVCFLLQYVLFIALCDFHCHAVVTVYKCKLTENGRLWINVLCAPIVVNVLK
jgi:hypothetical protein